ncbi:MAG: methyltransferase domain-containing protein [Succinivibrio sp.]|jgi:trans-aconitate methyltransferase|nr:methyltransferase domain-containing protein [Succinivibrio sp.]
MNISWNAAAYNGSFSFVSRLGSSLLDLIEGTGLRVLDLGCGTGTLTHELALRGFAVTGLDASEEQLKRASADYPKTRFLKGDACDFSFDEPFDAVFSNAVFHWIDKERQMPMLSCVRRALKKGGQFVFEMGGRGNNALIHEALAKSFAQCGLGPYRMPFYFPKIGEYAPMVEQAGFTVRKAWLFDRPTPLKGPHGLEEWIRMFVKTPFAGIAKEQTDEVIARTVRALEGKLCHDGRWQADYVRLRMAAEAI